MKSCIALLCGLLLMGCATTPPAPGSDTQINALARAIAAMSPQVDQTEARRAATMAFAHTHQLALEYQITDPPLVHNAKVNAGMRPRGLCYHWAEDMEKRLDQEQFRTLDMARAIANSQSRFLIEHSTAVITPKGAPMQSGIVLDPWRKGGTLFWSPVGMDPRYDWKPREEVLRAKGQIRYAQRPDTSLVPL